jgi:hypothetical protein
MTGHGFTQVLTQHNDCISLFVQLLMTILQDVDIFLGGALLPKQLKQQLRQVNSAFTLEYGGGQRGDVPA